MTKKGKRTAFLQYHERIAELERDNAALRATIAQGSKGAVPPPVDRELSRAPAGSDSDAFTICDARLTVIDMEESALRYFGPGLRREEVIGKNLAELLPDRERCGRYLKVVETGERFTAEESVALPGGGEARVKTRAFRVGDRLAILSSDVTARRRAEEALRASDKISRAIQDNINEGVVVIQDGLIKLARFRGGASIRATSDDMLGRPFLDSVHPDDRQTVLDHYSRRQKGEEAPRRYQFRFLDTDGGTHWIEVRSTLLDWDGRPATLALLTRVDDRRNTELALKASEEKYRLLIEKTNDVIWTASLDLVLTYVSPSVERALGFTPEEHLKRGLSEQLTPDSLARAHEALQKHLELERHGQADPEGTLRIELEYYRRDGSTVWMEQHISGLRDARGTLTGIHGVARDISRQKEAQEALEESEAKYRALAEESIQGLVLAQGEPLRVLYCNSALARMLGYTSGEIEAMLPAQYVGLIHADDRETLLRHYQDRLSGANVEPRLQYRGVRRDGNVVWIEMASTLVQYEGTTAVQASLIDITERIQAEETLRASEERYRRLVEHANEGIAVLQDGLMKYVNPQLAAMAGCTAEEMLNRSFLDFTHPDDRQMAVDNYIRRQRGETPPSRYLFRFLRGDGSTGWAEMSATLLEWDGRTASLAMINDVSERVMTEQALAESEAKYRNLFDQTMMGTAVVDVASGTIVLANDAMARIYGFGSAADMVGVNLLGYAPPEERKRAARKMARGGVYSGKQEGVTIRTGTQDGRAIWVTGSATEFEHEGRPSVLVCVVDTTAAKEMEDRLHESEEKYRLLVDNANQGTIVVQDELVAFANPKLAEMTGYAMDELVPRPFLDLLHPDDRETVRGSYLRRISGEELPHVYPARLVDREGQTIWAELNAVLIGWQGRPAVLALVTDITERREAQEALAASEAKYRDLFEHTLLGMEVVDSRTGRVVLANRSSARVFGFKSPADMVGVNTMAHVLPEDRESVLQQIAQLLQDPSWDRVATIRAVRADGRLIWVTAMTTQFEYEGQPAMLISVLDATATKEAELKLQEREEQYRLLVDNATEAIAVLQDGRIRFGNRRFMAVSGYAPEEFLSAPSFLDFVYAEDRERLADYYMRRLSGQEVPGTYQFRFVNKAGEIGWTEVNVTLVPWEGKPATLCLMDIITERRQAEESLKASEEKYRLLTEKTNDVIWTTDMNLRTTYLSPSAEKVFGFRPEERLGVSAADQMTPDSFARAQQLLLEQLEMECQGTADPQRTLRIELEYYRKDGSTIWMEALVGAIRDASGKLIGAHGVSRDIDERRKTQKALRESERRYRLLAVNATDIIWTADAGLKVTYVSPSVSRLMGYAVEDILDGPLDRLLTPTSMALMNQVRDSSRAEEERAPGRVKQRALEVEMVRQDGSILWMEAAVNALRDSSGRFAGFQGACRDISERRRAEETLRASEERNRMLVENANEAVTVLQNGLIVFGNPKLDAISGYASAELLRKPFLELVHPNDREMVMNAFYRTQEEDIPSRLEFRLQDRAGDTRWVQLNAALILWEGSLAVLALFADTTERKEAEEALRLSEDRFRTIFEKSPIGAIVYDADGKATDVNEACTVIFGLADRQSMKSVSLFDDPYLTDAAKEKLRAGRAIVGESPIDLDRAREQGQYQVGRSGMAHIRLILTPLGSAGERPGVGFLGLVEDVTERQKAEAELRHSEERLSLALEAASAGMFDWNMITGEMHFSDRFYTMLGYHPGEFPATYESFESLWHPDERLGMTRIIDQYRNNKTDHHEIEMRLRAKSGEWRWVASHGRMVLSWGQEMKPSRLVGAQFDITGRKEMEEQILRAHAELEARVEQRTGELKEANRLLIDEIRQRQQAQKRLQESESKYRELVENANSIIMELDTRGRVTFFNRFAEEFYGFKEAEIIGRHVVGTIAPPVDSAGKDMKAQTRDLVKHPEGYFVTENEGMRRNGERVWISWTNKGLHDVEGRLRNILCIGMDRTEQRRVADMLAEQLKEKAAADERQRLARDLHDAVTQTLFSASLIAEVLPQLWRKDRGEAERRLDELRRLTRGSLAEMRMLLLELRPGALGEVGLVDLLRQLVEATTAQSKVRLDLSFRGRCGVPAEVQVALYRVAQEALNNVVKHSGATEAEIRLNCRPGAADLVVSDNGSGFDPQEVSPKSLGLRIMQERVEAVGATLKIEGRAGGGTRVRAVWSDGRRKGDS